jgi:hypothetical protein
VTTPNPPIPGHHLLDEGAVWPIYDDSVHSRGVTGHSGGCQCGAKPPGFPNVSRNAMKEWHRGHKEEIRAAGRPETVTRDDVLLALGGEPETNRQDNVLLLHQVLDAAEEALRLGDHERVIKIIFVWSQRREHLLAGEETWEDQHI